MLLWLMSILTLYWWQRQTQLSWITFFHNYKTSIKIIKKVKKFLEMHITSTEEYGYAIDQEVTIQETLNDNGLEHTHSVYAPIVEEANKHADTDEQFPDISKVRKTTRKAFESRVGSLL